MSDVSLGVFVVLIGIPGALVLLICLLRILNRRAASRASMPRPGDSSHQTPQELQALRNYVQRR